MPELISVGIVGIGFGQHVLVPAFRSDARCRVVGLCASTLDRAREVAGRLEIARAFGDWREIAADPAIDLLAIAVPPALQASVVSAASASGKAVFCEKPIATSLAEARAMVLAVEEAGVAHAVDFLFPELAPWVQARAILDEGTLGPLRQVALSWRVETYAHRMGLVDSWKLRREEGGGALNSFASHSLYYLEWLLGPIARVTARLTPRDGSGDARVDAWLEFSGGVPGQLAIAADAFLGPGHRLEVYGEQGTLVLENRTPDHAAGFTLAVGTRRTGALRPVVVEDSTGSGMDGRTAAAARIAGRLVDAVSSGGRVRPDLRDGLRVQILIEAIRAADESGAWRTIPLGTGPGP
jgi:predicted dehydrogenase